MSSGQHSGLDRRSLLRGGAVVGAASTFMAAGLLPVNAAPASASASAVPDHRNSDRRRLPYPDVADVSHASSRAVEIFRGFFSAKSRHDPDALMRYFDRDSVLYIDASSGNVWPTWDSLNGVFHAFLPPAPPAALSYPLRIVGDEHSAMVEFEDTPELFGKELRILGSVTFNRKGKIARWIDYWDGRSSLRATSIGPSYPVDFHDGVLHAAPVILDVASALQAAFAAGDAATATALFSFDAEYEDMAAHTRVRGQLQIERYLARALASLPFGIDATLAHVEGSHRGGGYEWRAAPAASPMRRGHTALELDSAGRISRLTAVYDSGLLTYRDYQALVMLAAEAPL
jgi:hypothetical protein